MKQSFKDLFIVFSAFNRIWYQNHSTNDALYSIKKQANKKIDNYINKNKLTHQNKQKNKQKTKNKTKQNKTKQKTKKQTDVCCFCLFLFLNLNFLFCESTSETSSSKLGPRDERVASSNTDDNPDYGLLLGSFYLR